jgi:hypothetical protein
MSENTAWTIVAVAALSAAVALIVCGHVGWLIAALLIFFILIGS